KSHAAVYGVISVQTAYLKVHYPAEYMTAVLSAYKHATENVALYIEDCRGLGLQVLPPDVNHSALDFSIEDAPPAAAPAAKRKSAASPAAIRFGLAAIKNVGEGAVQVILDARQQGGPFTSLDDLCQRADLRHVGKRALESLIKVGALDRFGGRAVMLEALDQIVNTSAAHFRAVEAGQMTLFGSAAGAAAGFAGVPLPKVKVDIPRRVLLQWEKELIGLYVSDHPLQPVMDQLEQVVTHYSQQLGEAEDGRPVVLAGVVTSLRSHVTKKGDPMGFVTVEDLQGSLDLVIFPKLWKEVNTWLAVEQIVVIYGKVDAKGGGAVKILVDLLRQDFKLAAGYQRPAGPAPKPAPVQSIIWTDDELPLPASDEEPALPPNYVPPPPDDDWPPLDDPPPPPAPAAAAPAQLNGHGNGNGNGNGSSTVPAPIKRPLRAEVRPAPAPARPACRVVVTLRASGDRDRDARLIRRVHGLLTSYPGADPFEFVVFEANQNRYQLRFPNSTTGWGEELKSKLEAAGAETVETRPL
ncbi:MAG: hypothetical protein KA764_18960, partial [Anaerolineales bacterium]|nr:hypothetical protein [Anaerolineales bacterium]